jgi:hypothetical protein
MIFFGSASGKVSHNAVWLFLRREGLRFKKSCSPSRELAQTSRVDASAGVRGRPTSIPDAWSLSTRPGLGPTWLRCADGAQKASGCEASRHMVIGGR